jgi:succinoglycan biosynthesis transport protein ExoP
MHERSSRVNSANGQQSAAQFEGNYAGPYPSIQAPGSSLAEMFGVVRRRKWVLIGVVAGSLLLGGIILAMLTPRYTAEAMILIESQTSSIASISNAVAGLPSDAASVQSEAYILNSRTLAHRVIDKLNLVADPEFNEAISIAEARSRKASADRGAAENKRLEADPAYQKVADEFYSRLSVMPQMNSRVIAVQFVSEDAEKSSVITNALVEEYILSRLEAKYDSTERANHWLSERIAELRDMVEASEQEVEQLRQEFGLAKGDGTTLSANELSEINAQLIMSRASRAELSARLRELNRLTESPDGFRVASEFIDSPLIQSLREQQVQIERTLAELSSEYGAKHPRIINLNAEAQDVDKKIINEVNKTIGGFKNNINVARAKERSLEASIKNLKTEVGEANTNSIKVRMVEREAEANRTLLVTLTARQKETLTQEDFDFQAPDARIISYADAPVEPSFPNNIAIMALLFIGSTFLGLFLILLLELLDRGVTNGEELAMDTGVPSLGFAPFIKAIASGESLAVFASIRDSAYGQSIKTLNWGLKLGFPDDAPPRTIMVTSSVPLEGKSTIAMCLAYNQAVTGSKVLLIDADMRRPTIHTNSGMDRGPGLVGLLEEGATFDEVVVQYKDTDLYIVPAGQKNSYDSEGLINSASMTQLLQLAVHNYDLVIIDTPPVLACSDARILGSKVDATVFVVRWNATKLAVVRTAIDQLAATGTRFAGLFLSMVNLKSYSTYDYGDSGAYSGEMAHYYAGDPGTPRATPDKKAEEIWATTGRLFQMNKVESKAD